MCVFQKSYGSMLGPWHLLRAYLRFIDYTMGN